MSAIRLFSPGQSPAGLTVADVIGLYRRHCVAEGVHCAEAKRDRDFIFGLFLDACGPLAVADAKPYHLTDFIEANAGRWRSVGTRRAKANMIRAAFRWAADQERIDRNPFKAVRYAESERRPELRDDSLAAIQVSANKAFEAALRFLRLTGCRASELCRAVWADVDLEGGAWRIPHHKTRKRTGKAKVVALVPEAVALLNERLAAATLNVARPAAVPGVQSACVAAAGAGPIFLNAHGRPWTRDNLWKCLKIVKCRLGLTDRGSVHGIRHRAASAMVVAGAPLPLVAAQLGHASSRTTEKFYVHLENQLDAIRAAARLGVPKG